MDSLVNLICTLKASLRHAASALEDRSGKSTVASDLNES